MNNNGNDIVSLWDRLGLISEYFISEHIRQGDLDTLRRARIITTFSLALIAAGIFYSLVYAGMGMYHSGIQVLLASAVALVNICMFRRTGRVQFAANVVAIDLFWILTELASTQGGETSPSLFWYPLLPVLATMLSGRRAGLIWTGVTIVALCAFVICQNFGYPFEQLMPQTYQRFWRLLVLVGLQIVLMSFAYLFELAKSRALAALQQQIQLVDNVVNSLPGVFYLIDDDLTFVRWNRNLEVVTGYSASEIIDKGPLELMDPAFREPILNAIREVFDHGESSIEADLRTRAGEKIPYYFTGRRIVLDGRMHLVGMGVDLMDKKKAEAALRESEERYALAINASNDGIWDWNVLTNSIYYSPRHIELLGVRPDEDLSHISTWANRIHPDDKDRLHATIEAHFQTREPFCVEYRLDTTWGGFRWFRDKGQAIWNDEGRAVRMVGCITDINHQRQLQDTLREQAQIANFMAEIGHALGHEPELQRMLERCSQAILRQLDVAIVRIWTFNETERSLELNAGAGQQSFTIDENERMTLGAGWIGKIAEERRPRWTNDVGRSPEMFDLVWATREGLIASAGYPLTVGGRLVGVIELFSRRPLTKSDIDLLSSISNELSLGIERQWAIRRQQATSDRVLAANAELEARQNELRATMSELEIVNKALEEARAAAESASKAKSEFLANMSHEIRTPMTAILGFADILLDDRADTLASVERKGAAHTIKRNGDHLLAIINDILDLSKIEAGKLTVETMDCSPRAIVEETLSLLRVRADEKGLTLRAEYHGDIPKTIHTDPTRLRQILTNMLGNAVKFTECGEVLIDVRYLNDVYARLRFDVFDSGLGMNEQQSARLFEEFAQADTSVTRRFGGTGLGLTISRRLARMLGGDVVLVKSSVGNGSHFRAEVAADNESASAAVSAKQNVSTAMIEGTERKDIHGFRVLLAEDGPDNQKLLSFHLRKAGSHVTIVENGRLAIDAVRLALANGERFDIILMDMQMPVMSGYEATGLLRQSGCNTPIIALTANAMSGDRNKCIRAGCDDYATKPIDRDALINTIAKYAAQLQR